MGLWHLSLKALTKGNAENVKSYAKELNNGEYNFHPFNENTLTGLEYIDMGIMYSHVTPDCLRNFHKFSEEIAAHFSEVKLICEEFDSDNQQLFTYWSNNGILRLIKKCKIKLYADDNFEVVRNLVVSAAEEAGLELNDCTEANVISFTYDALQEQGKVDLILDSLSMQFPDIEIVCLKETDDYCETPYESFCIISNGSCKWHQVDDTLNTILVYICGDYKQIEYNGETLWFSEITPFDAVRNPVTAVEKKLDKIRKGDTDYDIVANLLDTKSDYQREFLELLKPEDEEWLNEYRRKNKEWEEKRKECEEMYKIPSEHEENCISLTYGD